MYVSRFAQSKKKEMARLNRELQKAQAELNQQKRLRDDMGPQHIKIKEGISTLKRQVGIVLSLSLAQGTPSWSFLFSVHAQTHPPALKEIYIFRPWLQVVS